MVKRRAALGAGSTLHKSNTEAGQQPLRMNKASSRVKP